MGSIGILNLQQVDNFGCVLGAFSLLKIVCQMSSDQVELIDYRPEGKDNIFLKKIIRALRGVAVFGVDGMFRRHINGYRVRRYTHRDEGNNPKQSKNRKAKFENFRKEFLRRSKIFTMINQNHMPDYDIYIVGSDVVWLLEDLWWRDSPALLGFTQGKNCYRVSYAASLGEFYESIAKRKIVKQLYQKGLQRFDMVSVREESTVEYFSDIYAGKIYCCMDPTLLLTVSDYERIEQRSSVSNNKGYIYVYMLDDTGDFYKVVNQISKKTGLPIVRCCDQINGYENILEEAEEDGPADFLVRVKNANLIITNSFHAVCFSLIYHKNFFAVRRTTQSYKTEELLRKIGLMDRYLNPSDLSACLDQAIDFENVDKKLSCWRQESMNYLKKALTLARDTNTSCLIGKNKNTAY